jgi:CRP-like cAMP-binding protein
VKEISMSIPSLETILDRELAEKIISRSVEVFGRDGILFRQGEQGDCLYFVKSGEAILTMKAGDKEVRIRAGQGSLLGIPAIVENQPCSMTAKACWEAEVFRLSPDAFSDLIRTDCESLLVRSELFIRLSQIWRPGHRSNWHQA